MPEKFKGLSAVFTPICPSHRVILGTIVLACCFGVSGVSISIAQSPSTPAPAPPDGADGTKGDPNNDGANGGHGGNAGTWSGPAKDGEPDSNAIDGGVGTDGGKGGKGGDGGEITTVTGDSFSSLGTSGGNGGNGGTGGKGQTGGSGLFSGEFATSQSQLNAAHGGIGGNGGDGGTGGIGGEVNLAITSDVITFANGTIGGTGGIGGQGGNGGAGGEGGVGGNAWGVYTTGKGGNGGRGGDGGIGGKGGDGGDVTFTVDGAVVIFDGIIFGGIGGAGGAGGGAGSGGGAGEGGDNIPAFDGNDGEQGTTGKSGDGGAGGNAIIIIESGTATFSGINYIGGDGGESGGTGGKKGDDGHGTLTINGGTTLVRGTIDFRNTGGELLINTGGTLVYYGGNITGLNTINLNGGSLVNNGSTAKTANHVTLGGDSKVGGSNTLIIENAMTGEFSLEKIGTSTTIFLADNTYSKETVISEGRLQLGNGGTTGGVGGNINIAANAELSINRSDHFTYGGILSGAGTFIKEGSGTLTLTNANMTYTGTVEINAGSVIVGTSGALGKSDINIGTGGTLEVTATLDYADAPIQGGTLTIAGGTLQTTFADYSLQAGEERRVYIGNNVTGYHFDGGEVKTVTTGNIRYRILGDLNYDNSQLYYDLRRMYSSEMFPRLSPQLHPVIDNYDDGNEFAEYLMENAPDDATAERAFQSGFDFVNLASPMSILYNTKMGIGNAIYARSQPRSHFDNYFVPYGHQIRGQACEESVGCGCCGWGMSRASRDAWVVPFYGNNRGAGLSSGDFRYGYANDQYAIGFGIDQTQGDIRLGVMGVGGGGKSRSTGELFPTWNENSFGGAYFYTNTQLCDLDVLFTTGYIGMNNKIKQDSIGGNLTGSVQSGLASFSVIITQTSYMGGLRVAPNFGMEYGYYHQGGTDVTWNGTTAFQNGKARANMLILPVGVNLSSERLMMTGGILIPEFRARYIANVGDITSKYDVILPGSPTSAFMTTWMTDRHAGDITLGMSMVCGRTTLRFDYTYMFSRHYQDQFGTIMARWQF